MGGGSADNRANNEERLREERVIETNEWKTK